MARPRRGPAVAFPPGRIPPVPCCIADSAAEATEAGVLTCTVIRVLEPAALSTSEIADAATPSASASADAIAAWSALL